MIKLEGHNLIMQKQWHNDEIFSAECLGFVYDGSTVKADLRSTAKNAIGAFLSKYFKEWVGSVKASPDENVMGITNFYKKYEADFTHDFDRLINYPRPLFEHQKMIVMQSLNRNFNLIAAGMGTGKTCSSLTISKMLQIPRTIIICPSVVKYNWLHEADDWNYDTMCFTVLDAKRSNCTYAYLKEDFIILNFEQVNKHFKHLTRAEVGHIIIDEVHYLRNHMTLRAKEFAKLYEALDKPKLTVLSGTPIVNRVNDLFAYFKLAGHPLGRNHSFFISRYALKEGSKIVGSKNKGDLRFKLSNTMIRLKAEDCLDLPDMIIEKYYFKVGDISPEYQKQIEQLRIAAESLKSINNSISLIVSKKGRKSTDDMESLKELRAERWKLKRGMTGNIHTMNRLTSLSKIDKICEVVDSMVEDGRKVVIFSLYYDSIDKLSSHFGKSCTVVDGRLNSRDKDKHIQRFLNDDECMVFIGNPQAAGIGINLVNSADVIFTSFSFTSDQIEQSIKRLHRPGQTEKVNVYFTLAENSIDIRIFDLVKNKLNDINEILDNNKNVTDYGRLEEKLINTLIT